MGVWTRRARPCVPGGADRARALPCPGGVCADSRRRSLAVQSLGAAGRTVRRGTDAGGRLRLRTQVPAGAQPAIDAGAVRRCVRVVGGRRRADRAERRLARPIHPAGAARSTTRAIAGTRGWWPTELRGVPRGRVAEFGGLGGVARYRARAANAITTVHELPRKHDSERVCPGGAQSAGEGLGTNQQCERHGNQCRACNKGVRTVLRRHSK